MISTKVKLAKSDAHSIDAHQQQNYVQEQSEHTQRAHRYKHNTRDPSVIDSLKNCLREELTKPTTPIMINPSRIDFIFQSSNGNEKYLLPR